MKLKIRVTKEDNLFYWEVRNTKNNNILEKGIASSDEKARSEADETVQLLLDEEEGAKTFSVLDY